MNDGKKWYQTGAFWTLVIDGIVNVVMLVLVEYAPSETVELVQAVILNLQPIILAIIAGMFGSHVAGAIRGAVAEGALDAAYTMQELIDKSENGED